MTLKLLRVSIGLLAGFLAGCASQVRWEAGQLREQVMVYYNDEIMENLLREQEGLPFVHLDISSLSAAVNMRVAGAAGAGYTATETHGPTVAAGQIFRTITRTATWPFTATITPERTDLLTIGATPVLGKPEIYKAYRDFIEHHPNALVGPNPSPPETGFVPGTIKKHGKRYFYVRKQNQEDYRGLCETLFGVPRPKNLEKDVKAASDAAEQARIQSVLPR